MTWALATITALLTAHATASRRLGQLNVSGAMLFTTAGLLAGFGAGDDPVLSLDREADERADKCSRVRSPPPWRGC